MQFDLLPRRCCCSGYLKRLLALHAKTGAQFTETSSNVQRDGGVDLLADAEDPDEGMWQPTMMSSSAIAGMLRAKRSRGDEAAAPLSSKKAAVAVASTAPVTGAPAADSDSEDELALVDWRAKRK